ncbi:MAG: GNAT family N-acetyltransferase [Ruminococcus sp.]|nr:GNAT family N-acetyltransferase [Ruminococcus sp.]
MIKIIDKDFTLFDEFKNFCKSDSFGTRIYSHFLCYSYEFDFALFWVQVDENDEICSAVCKLDNEIILCLSNESDFEEISAFLSFQNILSVTFDASYKDNIDCDRNECSTGDILRYKGNDKNVVSFDIVTPDLKEYHNLLLSCESEDFAVPEYMNFLSDVSRRQQRNLCCIYGIKIADELASCAMTVSYTDFSVILGAVATHPHHRKHGYAGCIVKGLAEKFSEFSSVYIYTTVERNTRFYESLGFEVTDKWCKYTYGG